MGGALWLSVVPTYTSGLRVANERRSFARGGAVRTSLCAPRPSEGTPVHVGRRRKEDDEPVRGQMRVGKARSAGASRGSVRQGEQQAHRLQASASDAMKEKEERKRRKLSEQREAHPLNAMLSSGKKRLIRERM